MCYQGKDYTSEFRDQLFKFFFKATKKIQCRLWCKSSLKEPKTWSEENDQNSPKIPTSARLVGFWAWYVQRKEDDLEKEDPSQMLRTIGQPTLTLTFFGTAFQPKLGGHIQSHRWSERITWLSLRQSGRSAGTKPFQPLFTHTYRTKWLLLSPADIVVGNIWPLAY